MDKNQKYQDNEQDRRIGSLECDMNIVKDHIAVTNSEMGKVKTDVEWLVKFFWIVASSSIGTLLIGLANLLIKK